MTVPRPAQGELPRIGGLILIERVRQWHQNGGAANDGKLRHRRGPGPADDEMGGRDAHRQVGKEGPDLGVDAKPLIGGAHPRLILAARLLHDDEILARGFRQQFDRGRHDIRHDARALRAAGDEQPQPAVGEIGKGDLRRLDHHRAARDCRSGAPWRRWPG